MIQALDEKPCQAAITLDHLPQAAASQRTERCPKFNSACTPRGLGRELPGLSARALRQIGGDVSG